MKYVFADWELRNLGRKTIEVQIESNDDIGDILLELENLEKENMIQYVVIKNNANNSDFNHALQMAGYYFIEEQVVLDIGRKKATEYIKKYETKFKEVSYQLVIDKKICDSIKVEIEKGIFTTDRIAVDSNFGIEVANKRYSNWLEDEYKRGNLLYSVAYKKEDIGFFLTEKTDTGIKKGLLSGIFKSKILPGGGVMIFYAQLMEFIENSQAKKFLATVSTNNLAVLKLVLNAGFDIINIENVFCKHL